MSKVEKGLRTQAANDRLANAHAEYVGRMRQAGDIRCTHQMLERGNGKTLLVFCDHCAPRRLA